MIYVHHVEFSVQMHVVSRSSFSNRLYFFRQTNSFISWLVFQQLVDFCLDMTLVWLAGP